MLETRVSVIILLEAAKVALPGLGQTLLMRRKLRYERNSALPAKMLMLVELMKRRLR